MAVSKAVRENRIPTVDAGDGRKLIDANEADKAWLENSDEAKQIGGYTANAGHEPTLPPDGQDQKPSGRAKREEFQARIVELKYREMAGELVEAESVKKEAFLIGRQTREAVLSVPDRLSSQLAAEKNPQKIHVILTKELTKALEAIAVDPE